MADEDHLYGSPSVEVGQIGDSSPSHYRKMRKRVDLAKDFVRTAKDGPCKDCGGLFPPVAMDFDHLTDKSVSISALIRFRPTIGRLMKEIRKCDLVCANCHRERTWGRSIYH